MAKSTNTQISRRDFIASSIVAAGALVATPLHAAVLRKADGSSVGAQFQPVDFSHVTLTDAFWKPKMEKVATATLAACIFQTEKKTGRIRNYEKAARRQGEKHEGIYYDDSDVYKALEAIAYSLKNRPDAALEKKADEWIDKIAAAQLPDGYLNTYYTLTGLEKRWTDMEKHEDYCAGHLIEAAVAYFQTTGKRKFLDVAIRLADHIDQTFRDKNRPWVSGHQEIELALVKLYHVTNERRYLKLADWFLEQRGRGHGEGALWTPGKNPDYCQDSIPVKDQRQIVGHAVRAMYLYTGAADVAAVTKDPGYMKAMEAVWEDVVSRNMYITGGIGSSGENEGFSVDYDLPNKEAYCETCASVGMVFWNQRMNLMTGDAKYIDILERSLYNGALAGLSLSGDRFFYGNPLASDGVKDHFGKPGRKEWFGTACCPSNIARLVASVGGYVYGASDSGVWVNLFATSSAKMKVGEMNVSLKVETGYPLDGAVRVTLSPERSSSFALNLRIPGWARNMAVPSDLYRFTDQPNSPVTVKINGKTATYKEAKGYAVIDREWKAGDVVEFHLPMETRTVVSKAEVKTNTDRIAFQRGPIMYCVEGTENPGLIWRTLITGKGKVVEKPGQVLTEEVVKIEIPAKAFESSADRRDLRMREQKLTAIPYYAWANRDNFEMQVWLPTKIESVKINS